MTTYHYSKIAVYSELGGALRLARQTRVFITDPATGLPVDVTQGAVTAPYADSDDSGHVEFTTEDEPWPLRWTNGTLFEDVYPLEAPQAMKDAVVAAEAAQQAAEDAAAAATGPADATVAGLVGTSSATRTALDARYVQDTDTIAINRGGTGATTAAAALVALGGDPLSLTGTYAARPAANTVPSGTIYYADNLEQYRSNGTAWSVVGPGGNELAYAEITASYVSTTASALDVPGLAVSWTAGERPCYLIFSGLMSCGSSTPLAWARLILGASTLIGVGGTTATSNVSVHRAVRIPGLTPGVAYTAKVRLDLPGGTTGVSSGQINAAATNPASLRVVAA